MSISTCSHFARRAAPSAAHLPLGSPATHGPADVQRQGQACCFKHISRVAVPNTAAAPLVKHSSCALQPLRLSLTMFVSWPMLGGSTRSLLAFCTKDTAGYAVDECSKSQSPSPRHDQCAAACCSSETTFKGKDKGKGLISYQQKMLRLAHQRQPGECGAGANLGRQQRHVVGVQGQVVQPAQAGNGFRQRADLVGVQVCEPGRGWGAAVTVCEPGGTWGAAIGLVSLRGRVAQPAGAHCGADLAWQRGAARRPCRDSWSGTGWSSRSHSHSGWHAQQARQRVWNPPRRCRWVRAPISGGTAASWHSLKSSHSSLCAVVQHGQE